jgi:hypothetical protein
MKLIGALIEASVKYANFGNRGLKLLSVPSGPPPLAFLQLPVLYHKNLLKSIVYKIEVLKHQVAHA